MAVGVEGPGRGVVRRVGVEGFGADLGSPKLGVGNATSQGPGAYDRLVAALRSIGADPRLLEPLARAWAERSFETAYARPLLLLAAMRYRALETPDHPLALELLMDAEAPDLDQRLIAALGDPDLVPVLAARSVQTNEPGRAFAWGLPALTLGLAHRAFDLLDLGCSAGLNLVVDRTSIPYRFGVNRLAGFDFPSPERRVGLDRAPIDVREEAEARWLEACIWPGQPERMERLTATRDLYRRPWRGDAPAPELIAHELGAGLTADLADARGLGQDRAVIAYESVVRPYLDPAARARHDADLWRFLERDRRRLWAVLEPADGDLPGTLLNAAPASGSHPMTLTVHFVRGGQRTSLALAQSAYHAAACVIVPGAIARLTELWNTP